MTSTISPSTAAALSANSWCNGLPAAAMWKITTIMPQETTASKPAIHPFTVARNPIAPMVARHGGATFQTNMFSIVKTAFEVAVTRLVNMPGIRFAK